MGGRDQAGRWITDSFCCGAQIKGDISQLDLETGTVIGPETQSNIEKDLERGSLLLLRDRLFSTIVIQSREGAFREQSGRRLILAITS